jgi:methionine sulfoxide reductase heme-binding subunit
LKLDREAAIEVLRRGAAAVQLIWPWQDRQRGFSALKAGAFALMLAPAAWLGYQLDDGQLGIYPLWLGGLTYWSGVWATAILFLALAITPAITIFRWRVLIDVRRMVGVTALVYSIAHIPIYFALRSWNFAFILNETATRPSLIAATVSTIGLIVLGLTSLDAVVAHMGVKGWQRLHNTVYAVTALALLHALLSRGSFPEQYLMSGAFLWLMLWRALDRYGWGANAAALAVLAVASSLCAALTEAVRLWLNRGYDPLQTLGFNFTLDFGIPPAWTVLGFGLAIALAAAVRNAPTLMPTAITARKVG